MYSLTSKGKDVYDQLLEAKAWTATPHISRMPIETSSAPSRRPAPAKERKEHQREMVEYVRVVVAQLHEDIRTKVANTLFGIGNIAIGKARRSGEDEQVTMAWKQAIQTELQHVLQKHGL